MRNLPQAAFLPVYRGMQHFALKDSSMHFYLSKLKKGIATFHFSSHRAKRLQAPLLSVSLQIFPYTLYLRGFCLILLPAAQMGLYLREEPNPCCVFLTIHKKASLILSHIALGSYMLYSTVSLCFLISLFLLSLQFSPKVSSL